MRRLVFLATAALLVLAAAPALAQEGDTAVPAYEVSGGYGFTRDFDFEENFPAGWYFSAAANLNRWFAVVGEVTGSHKTLREADLVSVRVTMLTGMGGPRFFRKVGRFVPYGQALVGAAHARAALRSSVFDADENETFFALQPGVGVLMYFNHRIGAQVSADFRWIDPFERGALDSSEFRVLTGVVVGFGSR